MPLVGTAWVDVEPDLSRFNNALTRRLKSMRVGFSVTARLNSKLFVRALANLRQHAANTAKGLAMIGVAGVKSLKLFAKTAKFTGIALLALFATATGVFAGLGAGIAGVGAAFLGLGVLIAAQNKQIKKTFTDVFSDIKKQAAQLAQPFVKPLMQVATIFKQTFAAIAPDLKSIFATLAPTLVPLVQGIATLIKGLMPVFSALASAVAPMIRDLAGSFGQLAKDLSGFFTPIINALQQVGGNLFSTLLGGIGKLLSALGPLLGAFVRIGAQLLGPLLKAVNAIVGSLVSLLVPVMKALAPIIKQLLAAFMPLIKALAAMFKPILMALTPVISIIAHALMSVLRAITPMLPLIGRLAGMLIGAFAGALKAILKAILPILPPLFRFIGQLLTRLMPVLTPIISLLGKVAGQLLSVLGKALLAILPSLMQIVNAILGLLPAITPLIPLIVQLAMAFIPLLPPLAGLIAALVNLLVPILRILITVIVKVVSFVLKLLIPVIQFLVKVISIVVKAITWFVKHVLGPAFRWLYTNVVKPVWAAIRTAISWAWNKIIKPVWAAIKWNIQKVLGPIFRWLYNNVVKPIWKAISLAIKIAWGVIKIVFAIIKWYITKVLGPVFRWIYNKVVKPVWHALGSAIHWVWTHVIRPAFNAVKRGVSAVGTAFRKGVDFIKRVWNGLKRVVAAPVNFVIGTIYDRGIRELFGKVGRAVGIKKNPLPYVPLVKYAEGGVEDHVAQIARPGAMRLWAEPETGGEAYIPLSPQKRGRSTQILGNVANRFGYGLTPMADGGVITKFADGGFWNTLTNIWGGVKQAAGWVGGKIEDLGGWLFDHSVGALWTKWGGGIKKAIESLASRGGSWGQIIKRVPEMLLKKIIEFFQGKVDAMGGGSKALDWAVKQKGKPYRWGATGPNAFDCSGLTSQAWLHGVGKWIGRTTYDQARTGKHIPRSKALPGDLWEPNPGHVMMFANPGGTGPRGMFEAQQTGVPIKFSPFRGPGGLGLHYSGGRYGGGPGSGGKVNGSWRDLVTRVLRELGVFSRYNVNSVLRSIQQESGGNARAVQRVHDINSGVDPAEGLNQVIGATFRAYAGKYRSRGRFDPYANIYASVRYARARYGRSWASVMARPGGYDSGGWLPPGLSMVNNATGRPEPVFNPHQWEVIERGVKGGDGASLMRDVYIQQRESASVGDAVNELDHMLRKSKLGGVHGRP